MPLWLLSALLSARKAAEALLGLVRTSPLQAALIASLCLSGWLWHGNTVRDRKIAARDAQIAAMTKASAENAAAQKRARDEQQAKFDKQAKEADNAYRAKLADARSATDRFIASHRLRAGQGGFGPAGPAGQSDAAGLPQGAAAVPVLVGMSEADVKACGDLRVYAERAFEWAQKLKAEGLAD